SSVRRDARLGRLVGPPPRRENSVITSIDVRAEFLPGLRSSRHPRARSGRTLRQFVRASLPLGHGTVLDPFMRGGSTIAAALAVGYESIGIEIDPCVL